MKRIVVLLGGALALCCSGCKFLSGGEELIMVGERVQALRAQAAGLRKDAADYALLVQRSEEQIKSHQIRLDALLQRRGALDKRIESLQARKETLPPAQAKELDVTLARYADEREALSARIDAETIQIRTLQQHAEEQRATYNAYLYRAQQSEREALQIEQYALEQAQQK